MKALLPILNEKCSYMGCRLSQFFPFLKLTGFIFLSTPEILGGLPPKVDICILFVEQSFFFPCFKQNGF